MARRKRHRGFTLIELLIGMSIGTILLFAIGGIMFQVFGGFREMAAFNQAILRVDLIRQLNFDARTGDWLLFPATDGTSGAYTEAGFTGQQIRFRTVVFDPVAETDSWTYIIWQSARPTTAPLDDPFIVRRFVHENGGATPPASAGDYTLTFGQGEISTFEVFRVNSRNFNVSMRTEFDGEAAAVEMSVTLRNVN
jgi:prepilin-type N-terminal cleavage/methylation domain-containing protein